MTLDFNTDPMLATWLFRAPCNPEELITLGPPGFECLVRLLYLPDPATEGLPETDAVDDVFGPGDGSLVEQAANLLGQSLHQRLTFCLWDGYSDMPLPGRTNVDVSGLRSYVLAQGTFDDLHQWTASIGLTETRPPAFTWPEDRSWCITSDVDPHWAAVACDHLSRDRLLASHLPTSEMHPNDRIPRYGS